MGLLGAMGLSAAALGLPLASLLAALGIEDAWWGSAAANVRWGLVMASASCDAVYYVATALALAVASPVFVAIGVLIGGPASMLVDFCTQGAPEPPLRLLGAAL